VITATLLMWGGVLVTGWALIIQPALGRGITAGGHTDAGWGSAFYYSAAVLTTLGPGGLGAVSTLYRMLQVTQAASGVLGAAMVVTYFLSVYGGVTARKTFASALHLRTGGTGDAAHLLAALSTGGELSDARGYLTDIGDKLLEMQQTHRSYPVLRYFYFRQARYALPRILLVALDAVTLLEAALGPRGAARTVSTATLVELRDGALGLLDELAPGPVPPTSVERAEAWRVRYQDALACLRESGIDLPPQAEQAADRYAALRERWDEQLRFLAHVMAYPWYRIDAALREADA
jgi:hypothetical protein